MPWGQGFELSTSEKIWDNVREEGDRWVTVIISAAVFSDGLEEQDIYLMCQRGGRG